VDAPRIPLSLLRSSQLGLARAPILCSHFPHGKEHGITCLALLFLAPLVPLLSGPFSTMLSLVSLRCYRSTHMSCSGYALSIVDTHLAVVLRFQPEFLPESDACQIVGSRYRIRKKARGLRKGFKLCHVSGLCQVIAQRPKGQRVRGFRLSPGLEPCWAFRSHGDLVDVCQGFCQHSLWILWIAPWLTGLLAMVCLSVQIGLTPFALVCQDVSFKVVDLYPSSLKVPIRVACLQIHGV
jgi:hypothetical protein